MTAAEPVRVAGLTLRAPLILASGCAGRELAAYTALDAVGAVVTRSITLDPRPGGPTPRVVESPSGLLHSTGWPNPGLEVFCATELPELVRLGARVFVSIIAASLGEYAELARRIGRTPGVSAVEVNLAAPDAAAHGLHDAREPFHVARVVGAVASELPPGVPAIFKLRHDPLHAVEAARSAADAGAAAVVVGNAASGVLPDGRPAGLGGPAIAPLALQQVREVAGALPQLDVVGGGGIRSADDVRRHLAAGARAVQIGTALLHDPRTPSRILEALAPAPSATEGH